MMNLIYRIYVHCSRI